MAFLIKISKSYSCDFPPTPSISGRRTREALGRRADWWRQEAEGGTGDRGGESSGGFLSVRRPYSLGCSSVRRGAGPGAVSAPTARGAAREALPPPQSSHSVLRLTAVWPGEEIRDPALPVHARAGGAGHSPQPVRDAGGPQQKGALISAPSSSPLSS